MAFGKIRCLVSLAVEVNIQAMIPCCEIIFAARPHNLELLQAFLTIPFPRTFVVFQSKCQWGLYEISA